MNDLNAPVVQTPVSNIMRPLKESAGWMKLSGTLMLIMGILYALTIVGLIIAWLPIWVGVLLRRSANQAQEAYRSGDESAAVTATSSLRTVFTIYGVLTLIGLIFMAFMIILSLLTTLGVIAMQKSGWMLP